LLKSPSEVGLVFKRDCNTHCDTLKSPSEVKLVLRGLSNEDLYYKYKDTGVPTWDEDFEIQSD